MTNDALYLIDLFSMQRDIIKTDLRDKRIRRDKFDRYSYRAWAIQETLDAIAEYDEGILSVCVIRNILKYQMEEYDKWYRENKTNNEKFLHAFNIVKELYKLTGGWMIYE